jgi:hypothetical protein
LKIEEEITVDRHTNTHTETKSKYFDGHGSLSQSERANVCEHTTRMASLEFLKSATRGLREEWMEGNLKGDYLKLMSGLCLEDKMNWYGSSRWQRVILVSIRGQVMEYTYIFVVCSHTFPLF